MKIAIALAATLISAPVLAQSTTVTTPSGSYYIVQDVKTKRCTVTHERPTGAAMTIVGGDGAVYKTETEAQAAVKTTKVCTSN
ncbi:MAG: hypothetical protein JWN93_3976 [Hyphomicrobiales bacterium]|nr:hypothetical protein [Hyphomicrobiales bacterium]